MRQPLSFKIVVSRWLLHISSIVVSDTLGAVIFKETKPSVELPVPKSTPAAHANREPYKRSVRTKQEADAKLPSSLLLQLHCHTGETSWRVRTLRTRRGLQSSMVNESTFGHASAIQNPVKLHVRLLNQSLKCIPASFVKETHARK